MSVPFLAKFLLVIVPVAIPIVTAIFVHLFGAYEGDPSYGPLMSALNLLHFEPPGYALHPGTPIHILGALMLVAIWLVRLPVSGLQSLDADILLHPDLYLYWMNIIIAFLIGGARYYLGIQLLRATGSLVMAIAGQATIFMSYPFLLSLPLVTPDSLIIFTTTLFVALLVPVAISSGSFRVDKEYGVKVGAVAGLCLATKITCMPLCILLFLLRDRRVLAYALCALVIAFFLSILPAIGLISETVADYIHILGHTGSNGAGASGFPSVSELMAHFYAILAPGTGLLVALGLTLPLLLVPRSDAPDVRNLRFFFFLSALVMLFQYILVIKNPGDRYLAPAYAVTALFYPALFLMARQEMPSRAGLLQAGIAALMVLVAAGAVNTTWNWLWNAHVANSDNDRLLARVASSGCDMVPYYDAPTKEYRLIFGNGTAAGRHSQALARLYPDFLSFHNGRLRFETFEKVLAPAEAMTLLHKKRCIYLVGSGMERMQPFGIAARMMEPVERTYHGPVYSTAVFRLKITPATTWSDLGLPPAKDGEK